MPSPFEHLCLWFGELCLGRPSGGFGLAAISYADILAWASLLGTAPSPAEVKLLLAMDRTFLAEIHRLNERRRPK